MPVRILSIPFFVTALVFLYMTWEVDESYSVYIIPPVVLLGLLFVFGPQINWWWYKRYPPKLDPNIRHLFRRHFHFYQKLSPDDKERFRRRVALYTIANDFMPQAMEKVPEDVKAFIAANVVQLTFGQEDFLLSKFERIVVYPKPFPTPQYPEKFHASEIFEEDGVVLFSAQQLAKGFLHPTQYYNIGLHEYAKVFMICYPEHPYPVFDQDIWSKLEQISGFSREFIAEWINLDNIDPLAVSISHFFVFPEKFRAVLPEVFELYGEIFRKSEVGSRKREAGRQRQK